MKLSVITDEISQDFEHSLDVMQEFGVKGAELRGLWNTNIADLTDEQAERAKAALISRDMQVVALSTPFYKCDLYEGSDNSSNGPLHLAQPRPLGDQLKVLHRCVELAQFFGTNKLRVFTFWRKMAITDETYSVLKETFVEPLKIAAAAGMTLLLENEHACLMGSGAEAARLASLINSPQFRICWDPGNAFALGENAFPDGYEAVKPWISHVHVKDAVRVTTAQRGEHAQFCEMGTGQIGYEAQFAALRQDNYAGWISLETHYSPTSGSGPEGKGTPEDASRACLKYLNRVLEQ